MTAAQLLADHVEDFGPVLQELGPKVITNDNVELLFCLSELSDPEHYLPLIDVRGVSWRRHFEHAVRVHHYSHGNAVKYLQLVIKELGSNDELARHGLSWLLDRMDVFGNVLHLLMERFGRGQQRSSQSTLGFWKASSSSKTVDVSPLVLQCKRLSLEALLKGDAIWLSSLLACSPLILKDDLFKLRCSWTSSEYAVLLESPNATVDECLDKQLFGSLASDVDLLSDAAVTDASVLANQLAHLL